MRHDEPPRTPAREGRESASTVERLRAFYYRHSLRSRLVAALVVLVVVAVAALLAGLPVTRAVGVAAVALLFLAALMRSAQAVATLSVAVVWSVLATVLFVVTGAVAYGSPWILMLGLLPLPVSLAATRVRAFPVWHTTLIALLLALIVGLAVGLGAMLSASAPEGAGVVAAFAAAGLGLLWRAVAGYRLAKHGILPPSAATMGDASPPAAPEPRPRQRAAARTASAERPRAATDDGEEKALPVEEALEGLERMVGLDPVKQQVRSLAASIEAARLRAEAGYSVDKPLRHFVFSGPPGTGKTSVARVLAAIFHSLGLLPTSRVVEASRADLVGEYLGATAIKTNALVDSALGGVLFIDEAYSLVNDGDGQSDRFGQEAVQTLLKRAEDDRDQVVIILAGYDKEMDHLLASNPGLASRFATRVTFPSYSAAELVEIATSLFEGRGDVLEDAAVPVLRQRFEQLEQRGLVDELGNGRLARSLVEKSTEARDVRVVTGGDGATPNPAELLTVREPDIVRAMAQLTERLPGYSQPPDVGEALAELDTMIGLEPVKQQIRSIAAQLQVAKLRTAQGLQTHPPMRHFVCVGPPGTGKTTVARILGRIFTALGLLTRADVVEASRADLVGEHLGATAVKTNKLVDSAMGGVLFIDEAYSLTNPGYSGGDAFGTEAIQTLLKRAEDDRSRLVIVLAGYPAEMDRFLATNAGLASRFNVRVAFPSYTAEELVRIAETVAARTGDSFEEAAREDLERIFGYVCSEGWIDELGNGRFARSLYEKACSYRDLRVAEELGDAATTTDLTLVTSQDVRKAYAESTER